MRRAGASGRAVCGEIFHSLTLRSCVPIQLKAWAFALVFMMCFFFVVGRGLCEWLTIRPKESNQGSKN
jgi:hypothetical protein